MELIKNQDSVGGVVLGFAITHNISILKKSGKINDHQPLKFFIEL